MSTIDPAAALDELLDPERVWAIRSADLLSLIARVRRLTEHGEAQAAGPGMRSATRGVRSGGATATINILGPITRRPSFVSWLLGTPTALEVSAALNAALADDQVSRIVLTIDSPGGEAAGMTELAEEIYRGRSRKPITAFVDTMAASAAYWIAASATEIVVTPSGQVGSIGVIAVHLDHSRALDAAGVTPTIIAAGKYKGEGTPLQPLDEAARTEFQRKVDAVYQTFLHDVARGRGVSVETVTSSYGEGRMVLAKDAVKRGMADQVAARLSTAGPGDPRLAIAAAAARAAVATLDMPGTATADRAPEGDPALVFARAHAMAAVRQATETLAEMDQLKRFVVIPTSEVHPVKAAMAVAAVAVAARDLRLTREPTVEFFIPDDGREGGERFTARHDRLGDTDRDDGSHVRVRADVGLNVLLRVIGHEVCHCAQSPAAPVSEREDQAYAYAETFESKFWRSPEAAMVNRWALGGSSAA